MEVDHLTIPVRDYELGKRFYAELLEPLGYRVVLDWPDRRRAYLGIPPKPSSIWVIESVFAGAVDVSLSVTDRGIVALFHAAATAAGARSLDAPGIRAEREQHYYAARVADYDGNTIEAVCRLAAGARAA